MNIKVVEFKPKIAGKTVKETLSEFTKIIEEEEVHKVVLIAYRHNKNRKISETQVLSSDQSLIETIGLLNMAAMIIDRNATN